MNIAREIYDLIKGAVLIVSVTGTDSLEILDNKKIIEFNSGSNFTFTIDQMYVGFTCDLLK